MCSSLVLQSPEFSQHFLVQVDASTTGTGAVLVQGNAGEEKPVVFLSRKLLPRETQYSAIEKECLAIMSSLDNLWYYFLQGTASTWQAECGRRLPVPGSQSVRGLERRR